MPTVAIYVPIQVARNIAQRWAIDIEHSDFQEIIRASCAEALDFEAGISYPRNDFQIHCQWAHLHTPGRRCRHCGGS